MYFIVLSKNNFFFEFMGLGGLKKIILANIKHFTRFLSFFRNCLFFSEKYQDLNKLKKNYLNIFKGG